MSFMLSCQEKQSLGKYHIIAGMDEAGRGSLAGPITAAVVAVKNNFTLKGVKDSKLLSFKQREEIFEIVKKRNDLEWRICHISSKIIDRINILQANILAWKNCFKKLKEKPGFLLLDGNKIIPSLDIGQKAVINGDRKIFLISLASIIAKVSRDKLMSKLEKEYPQYGFARHKGYGTKFHRDMIRKHGSCPIHRKSFRLV